MRKWEWLGEPLALDFANTVRRRGLVYEEHLNSADDLAAWAAHVGIDPPAAGLAELRVLRDAVFALLLAAARGEPCPPDALRHVNAMLAPLTPGLAGDGGLVLTGPDAPLAAIATSVLEHLHHPALAFCDAPSCGQFFLRHRRDQRWCGPPCGTRARVARHSARHRLWSE
jgi:predicted RNA-binding Zn ribbon-like protein